MQQILNKISMNRLSVICQRYGVRRLSIFGSFVRGGAKRESDLDVLVEFLPGHVPGFSFIRLQDELSSVFGQHVDLHTPGDLSKYFRDSVVKEAQPLYVVA